MKAFMQNPRTGLPALAVFVTLVLSFAIPPFNSVVAAGSSSRVSASAVMGSARWGGECPTV